jgi:hypothetical protein
VTNIRPFCLPQGERTPLPDDVLAALEQPGEVRTGCLVVFATSAVAAWRHLDAVGLAPGSQLELRQTCGGNVDALDQPTTRVNGAVYVTPVRSRGNRVIQITPAGVKGARNINLIGDIQGGQLVLLPSPRPASEPKPTPVVTDAMLDAASEALPARVILFRDELQQLLLAALHAQQEEQSQ